MDKQIRIRKLIVFIHVFNDQTKDVCNVFVHILFSILFSLAEGAVIETDALYGHTPLSRRVANLSRSPSMGAAMRFDVTFRIVSPNICFIASPFARRLLGYI